MASAFSNSGKTVAVIGGGVAGMSAACALAEAGLRVKLIERRGYLGGRASSYPHPGVNEVIDNCQHVLFGCCTNLIGFYRRIGVAERIHWTRTMTMIEPGGRRSRLGPSFLPAPLHGLPRMLAAKAFTLADKRSLARAFRVLLRPVADSNESLAQWLARNGQTHGAVERFWRLVIASALNADLECISVPYAAKVIRELFMNSAEAGAMGMSSVPLSELYAGARRFLVERGSEVLLNAAVERAAWDEETSRWTIATRGGDVVSDFLVMALPFEATAKLIAGMPPAEGAEALLLKATRHEHWPISSVHLWFDREITDLEHAVLLDREIHWMYNKSRLQPGREGQGSYLELVQSASRRFAALPREQAIQQAIDELAEFFPAVRTAKLVKAALVKEVRATFGVPPGVDRFRPASQSPWPNCVLAGDWTATGWPSTMESAARSGHLAAEAVCRTLGQPRRILVADLKPRGLMRWVKR
ncbi:MAG TPA: hydroxysqualene dehydroxylase HpnE [Terracidiphilus sp.]|nr:hydroxysqualene dehydroxylase HpnE [Terracidiphilus sp.]